MHFHHPLLTTLSIFSLTTASSTLQPRALTCPASTSLSSPDTLCASTSGALICASRLDTCCQLPDKKTPYTCAGLGASHCCGTDTPACGNDPACVDSRGERSVEEAREAVRPVEGAAGGEGDGVLGTVTGKMGPVATSGAGGSGGSRAAMGMGVVGLVVMVVC